MRKPLLSIMIVESNMSFNQQLEVERFLASFPETLYDMEVVGLGLIKYSLYKVELKKQ